MDNVYPKPAPPVIGEDEFVRADAVAEIVDLVDNGAREGYSGFNVGDKLDKCQVTSITQARLGITAPKGISNIYDEIEAEKTRLEAIHPCEYETAQAFLAALNEHINDLDKNLWLEKLSVKFGVANWGEMQDWCAVNYNQEPE